MPSFKFHRRHIRLDKMVNPWARECGELPGTMLAEIIEAVRNNRPIYGTFIERKSGRYLVDQIAEDYKSIGQFDEDTIQAFMQDYYVDKGEFLDFCELRMKRKLPGVIARCKRWMQIIGWIEAQFEKLKPRDPQKEAQDKKDQEEFFNYLKASSEAARKMIEEQEADNSNDNTKISIAVLRRTLNDHIEEMAQSGDRVTKDKGFEFLSEKFEGRVTRNFYDTRIWTDIPEEYKKPGRPAKKAV